MREMYKVFAGKLFGVKYESLKKILPVCLIVFYGLYISGFQVQIASAVLYLMVTTFTAGIMWQALDSEDHAANMKNLFMLPFEKYDFIFSYVAALGTYTVFTKTVWLLSVVLAVSSWNRLEIFGSFLCAVHAVLMTACIYSWKKYWGVGLLWGGATIVSIFILGNDIVFFSAIAGSSLLAVLGLAGADVYSFYLTDSRKKHNVSAHENGSVWRYLFRYLMEHKNYLINTAVMWGVACVLPAFLGEMEDLNVLSVGFAILTLNTPVCILLSCDPALEQAVRFLPGQKKAFCIPYCLFVFLCNMVAEVIFLCSWKIQIGEFPGTMILDAVFFALQAAVASVLLEWFCPIRGWKMESDLWHHPRKYIVPVIMLLLAGAIELFPRLIPILVILLAGESMLFLIPIRSSRNACPSGGWISSNKVRGVGNHK